MDTIVVAGAIANKPDNGGEAWVRSSWVRGLLRLGLDAWLVEVVGPTAEADPRTLPFFREALTEVGLLDRAYLLRPDGSALHAGSGVPFRDLAEAAALLVNISGHLSQPGLVEPFRRRAFVDLDPGYTQHWHAQGHLGATLADHDSWFTVGLGIGRPGCSIPTVGLEWQPVLPPVVLDEWPVTPVPGGAALTTVAAWRGGFGALEVDGRRYGQKAHEWRRFAELPGMVSAPLEAALHIDAADAADRDRLQANGWRLVEPRSVARTPAAFRAYVQGSFGEWSVAQGVYVETASGWFSDRTTRYLASGRPAIVQDTGIGTHVPVGEGLLVFSDLASASEGIRRLVGDPAGHGAAARALAERHLDSDRVIPAFLERAFAGPPPR